MLEPFPQPIDARTLYCAVFGHPIRHSASPAMQNAGLAALGLNWRYLACDVHPEELRAGILGAQTLQFIGLNLTVPHKLLAMQLVDVLDESAKSWRAVNTIRFEGCDKDGSWQPLAAFTESRPEKVRSHGFNTDADAIIRALQDDLGLNLRGSSVLLLGVGGAGQVAALKLAAEAVSDLFLINRTSAKAEAVASEIQRLYPRVKVHLEYPRSDVDLVLNATSLGLKSEDPLPLDTRQFSLRQARTAYDMIYRPAVTSFLAAAKAAGCRVANGLSMLLFQGAKALEIWSGQAAPVEVMRRALEQNVYGGDP